MRLARAIVSFTDESFEKIVEHPGSDKFGVTWQVVPAVLDDLLSTADDAKRERVMAALLKMKKLDIKTLKAA